MHEEGRMAKVSVPLLYAFVAKTRQCSSEQNERACTLISSWLDDNHKDNEDNVRDGMNKQEFYPLHMTIINSCSS